MADKYLNGAGLTHLWAKLKTAFAPKTHTHTVSDVTGTLPLAKGGTGATTAEAARTNLGVSAKAKVTTASLSASGWTEDAAYGFRLTLNVSGVSSDVTKQLVAWSPSAGQESAAYQSGVSCVAQGNGTLVFACAEKPAGNIGVVIAVQDI